MSSYIDPPIETDPNDLAEASFTHLQDSIPGWFPNDGNLETVLIEAIALMSAEVRDVASAVPRAIFRYFGGLVEVPPQEATAATVLTTWTMVDNLGYTIEAGTQVGIRTSGDSIIPFIVDQDYVIPAGTTSRNDVLVIASEPGADASGLGGTGTAVELIDSLAFVETITQNATTAGGTDAETDDEYLDRLTRHLRLFSAVPILPQEFADLAADQPGVDRALALDGYNPADQTNNNERMVAVALTDELGQPVSAPVKSAVDALLQSLREVNFVVNIIDPTYTTIDVNVTVNALPGYDTTDIQSRIVAELEDYLAPQNWGRNPDTGVWGQSTTVRYLEIVTVVNNVLGVDYIESLTMRKGANAFAAADIALTGAAPLTDSGAISVTVNP